MRLSVSITCITFLVLQVLTSKVLAASSDSFPWSDQPLSDPSLQEMAQTDRYGALSDSNMQPATIDSNSSNMSQTILQPMASNLFSPGRVSLNSRPADLGAVEPGGTVSNVGMAQGNIGPTQSGPGASGLFTPSSPGNAAAYQAQLSRGLQGSPIVDGSGANLRIFVPVSTPSGSSSYLQYMSGGVTGLLAPQKDFRQVINPTLAPGGFARTGSPTETIPIVQSQLDYFPLVLHHLNHRPSMTIARSEQLNNARLNHLTTNAPKSTPSQQIIGKLGTVTGTMQYADGDLVFFGTEGTLRIESDRSGTLSCNDGQALTFHDFSGRVRQLAQGNQLGI